jgi:16S rRNA (guanine527-N7)-methyltransferase
MTLLQRIEAGLGSMQMDLGAEAARKMAAHLELVAKWNRVHNLTAVRETEQMVVLHLLDSLSVLPHLGAARSLVDVGTGAGFPGIPVAIARPDLEVALLDSSHKKASFLEQARAELGLSNVRVACERVQDHRREGGYDVVVSRAFSELADFVVQAGHLVAPHGRFLAMKGVYPFEEIARVPATHRVSQVLELEVPALDAKRHLVVLEPA